MSTPSRPSPSDAQAERIRSLLDGVPVRAAPRRAAPTRTIEDASPPRGRFRPAQAVDDGVPAGPSVGSLITTDDIRDAEELVSAPPGQVGRLWEFTRAHAHILSIIVVVALVFTAFRLMGASGHDVPAPTPSIATPTVVSSSAAPELIVVHVRGAVVSPGVIRVEEGSRVADVLEAAGGLLPEGDIAELNLAAEVPDGAQVVVGTINQPQGEIRTGGVGGASAPDPGNSGTTRVNLNTATQAQLETLPGVGPVMAGRIIAWREEHGRFTDIQELKEVDGVGAKTYERLAALVEV